MRIENEVKLDFKDVLIRPKRSTLSTRSNVDITREFHFRHTQVEYHGVPIIAANMDTTAPRDGARAGPVPAVDRAAKRLLWRRLSRISQGSSASPPLSTRWASRASTRRNSTSRWSKRAWMKLDDPLRLHRCR
jgi:hypothetical protein